MQKSRLETFSDGVVAIILTIMVLEIRVPHGANFRVLRTLLPVFLSYVLSFVYVGIYWNSHHHFLSSVRQINGSVLWANLHLLFWLSLTPAATAWMGENHFTPAPLALYGVLLLMTALAFPAKPPDCRQRHQFNPSLRPRPRLERQADARALLRGHRH